MPPPKTAAAAAAASKACFINVPRIDGMCSYSHFLKSLLKDKHNRKVFSRTAKETVDRCFRLQATHQFQLDNEKLKRAMTEPDSDDSISAWKSRTTSTQSHALKAFTQKQSEGLEGLSVPLLSAGLRTHNRDVWKEISYERFVEQLRRKNPDTVLTKLTADSAFRLAAARPLCNVRGRESTITRILGKESTKYWKER